MMMVVVMMTPRSHYQFAKLNLSPPASRVKRASRHGLYGTRVKLDLQAELRIDKPILFIFFCPVRAEKLAYNFYLSLS